MRASRSLLVLALLASLATAGLAYRLCALGSISVEPRVPRVSTPQPPGGLRVAVLRSEATIRFLGVPADYDAHVGHWTKLVAGLGGAAERIADADLEGDLAGYRVLVLPSVVCLSDKGRAGVRAFLDGGGGVIATWAAGTRDEHGAWRGWDFLKEVTGADAFESRGAPAPWFLGFRGGSPLAAGSPGGARIQVLSPERLEATALEVDAYWCDARLFPRDSTLPFTFQGAAFHRERGRGRVVWLGFQENSAAGDDAHLLEAALANAVSWSGRRVSAGIEPWPWPRSSAALLAVEVDQSPENATWAAEALARAGARGTFFYPSERIEDARDVPALSRAGEVAWQARSEPVAGGLRASIGLASSRYGLGRRWGSPVAGLAHADLDSAGLACLAGAGLRYYFVDGAEGRSVRPAVMRIAQTLGALQRELDVVRLARTTDDDLHLSPLGLFGLEPEWIARRVLADFETVHGLGGLYVLSCHTQGLSAPDHAAALPRVLEAWQAAGAWIASADQIAGWWGARSHLSVTVAASGDSLAVGVRSGGPTPEGVTVTLYPASTFQAAGLEGSGARVVGDPANGRVHLILPARAAGASRYVIRLDR